MSTRNVLFLAAILSLSLLFGSGCGGSSGGGWGSQSGGSGSHSGNKGTILITAPFPSKAGSALKKVVKASRFIPLNVYIYVVTVCEQGTTTAVVTPVNINRPSSGDTVDASISDVPIGWKTVRVFAYDSGRNLLVQGASDVEVKSTDQGSSDVSVTLTSTSDAPSVSSTTPANALTSVIINTKITVLFSMAMLASSVTADTFYLKSSQGSVSGTVTLNGSTAVLAPSEALQPLTTYTALVSGNVQNSKASRWGQIIPGALLQVRSPTLRRHRSRRRRRRAERQISTQESPSQQFHQKHRPCHRDIVHLHRDLGKGFSAERSFCKGSREKHDLRQGGH